MQCNFCDTLNWSKELDQHEFIGNKYNVSYKVMAVWEASNCVGMKAHSRLGVYDLNYCPECGKKIRKDD